jgi:hypothetical protein
MRIKIVIATGLALVAISVIVVLLHTPETVAATNGIQPTAELGATPTSASACQAGEALPAGTSAIRLQIEATTGPRVAVEVFEGAHLVTRGTEGTSWFGSAVTIPVRRVNRAFPHTKVCVKLSDLSGLVVFSGAPTSPRVAATVNGKPLPGRLRIVYLEPARESWWSLAGAVIQHMGVGRAASGTWIVFPIVALAAAAIALGSWSLTRELR